MIFAFINDISLILIQLFMSLMSYLLVKSQVESDVELLTKLIAENDVIFLLMDTRESRWLPTVIANVKNKVYITNNISFKIINSLNAFQLVINAALGFDTFLVQRHAMRCEDGQLDVKIEGDIEGTSSGRCKKIYGSQLGCYFCSDVVGPGNVSEIKH